LNRENGSLTLTPFFLDLPPEEWERVRSMLGEVFEIYEIDEGVPVCARSISEYSLSLASDEMGLVES